MSVITTPKKVKTKTIHNGKSPFPDKKARLIITVYPEIKPAKKEIIIG